MLAANPDPRESPPDEPEPEGRLLQRIPQWILRPVDWIDEPHARRQARIHAIVLVILIPLSAGAMLYGLIDDWRELFRVSTVLGETLLVLTGLGFLVVAFLMLRSGRPRRAALVTVVTTFLIVWWLWWIDVRSAEPGDPLSVLHYLGLPILLASLILDVRKAAVALSVNFAAVSVLTLQVPRVDAAGEAHIVTFVGLISALAFTLAFLLYRETRTLQAQAYRLSEAGRHRMESVNALAHDVASPLSPVKTQLYLLSDDAGDDARAATCLTIIDRNLRHVEELLSDWRAVAEAESGRLRMQVEKVDVGRLVRDVVADLQATARAGGVQLEATIRTERVEVAADPRRLREVVYNLLTNAIKYSPGGGRAEAAVERVDDRVRVQVSDTGLGIAPEKLGRLFHPFSQVHDPEAVRVKSTGLGLYVSKQIVEAHGGSITARSAGAGQGATFSFEVPTTSNPAAAYDMTTPETTVPHEDGHGIPLWRVLTRPSPALADPGSARRGRLLAGVLIVMVPATAMALAYYHTQAGAVRGGALLNALMIAGMLVAYGLSRTRHVRWGAAVLLVVVTLALWSLWYQDVAAGGNHDLLFFLPVVVMIAVPFVSLGMLVAGAAANLALLVTIGPLAGVLGVPVPGSIHASLVMFYVLFGSLSVAAFSLTNRNQTELSRRAEAIEWADQARAVLSRRIVKALEAPLRQVRDRLPDAAAWRTLEIEEREGRVSEAGRLVGDIERLIDDLKELAKLDAGRLDVEPETVDLAFLHDSAVRLLGATGEHAPAGLRLEGESARVWADPVQTTKALLYLLRFGIRHAGDVDSVRAYGSPATSQTDWRLLVPRPSIDPEGVERHLMPLTTLLQEDGPVGGRIDLGLYVAKRILELGNASLAFDWAADGEKFRIDVGLRPAGSEATRSAVASD